jgi:hypothetical protein
MQPSPYPPAFDSQNLYFDPSVDIRHFVIDPLWQLGGFTPNTTAAMNNYCSRQSADFNNFTDVDRQTELTDLDGSLTDLLSEPPKTASPPSPSTTIPSPIQPPRSKTPTRPAISSTHLSLRTNARPGSLVQCRRPTPDSRPPSTPAPTNTSPPPSSPPAPRPILARTGPIHAPTSVVTAYLSTTNTSPMRNTPNGKETTRSIRPFA